MATPFRRRFGYYGFNFLWMYSWEEGSPAHEADERALDFIAKRGFNFVRIPTSYRFWTRGFNYLQPNVKVFETIDRYIQAVNSRGMHLSLNLHRAPGYCINSPEFERDSLWSDQVAEDAFVFTWEAFARRYQGISSRLLSFDLLNEPPNEGERGFTREIHERIMRRTVAAIRAIDPDREIVVDGIGGGHLAIPELLDLGLVQSGRGYQPMSVSHYDAGWWEGSKSLGQPSYPGCLWEGRTWDREAIVDFYQPWRDLEAEGARVHIGEFGCHNRTPNDIALRWFQDLFGVFRQFEWGYALWNFEGNFGIVDHGRPGAEYETIDGYRVDRNLLELMLENRV